MINNALLKREGFDPRPMMGGTSNTLGIAIKNAIKSPGVFMHSFMAHPLNSSIRNQVTNVLKDHNHPDTS